MAEAGPGSGSGVIAVSEANNNANDGGSDEGFIMGEPESEDFDIHASVENVRG